MHAGVGTRRSRGAVGRETKKRPKRQSARIATLLVLLALSVLAYALWNLGEEFYLADLESRVEHSDYETLRPGGLFGHGYGIVGTILILDQPSLPGAAPAGCVVPWLHGDVAQPARVHRAHGFAPDPLPLRLPVSDAIAVVTAASLGARGGDGDRGRYLYALTPRRTVARSRKRWPR